MITDGGLATDLEAHGHDLSDDLWSARLLHDDPDAIRDVHRRFFDAGADFATTASYQASYDGFARRGIDRSTATKLMRRSVTLAREAAQETGRTSFVAASIGPYGACLADGSEYRGGYGLTKRQLADWHRPRIETLLDADPDLVAVETIPDIDEAEAILDVLEHLDAQAWLSYTIDKTSTRAGQALTDAFALAADAPQVVAVGINCCVPEDVSPAIEIARKATGKPTIVYPNAGEQWDATAKRWLGPKRFTAELAGTWDAEIVGGCCRVSPADIAAVTRAIKGSAAE
ncbi:MAG TPA: homocysteine S-methyltransferase [Aldersonia sp.]